MELRRGAEKGGISHDCCMGVSAGSMAELAWRGNTLSVRAVIVAKTRRWKRGSSHKRTVTPRNAAHSRNRRCAREENQHNVRTSTYKPSTCRRYVRLALPDHTVKWVCIRPRFRFQLCSEVSPSHSLGTPPLRPTSASPPDQLFQLLQFRGPDVLFLQKVHHQFGPRAAKETTQ